MLNKSYNICRKEMLKARLCAIEDTQQFRYTVQMEYTKHRKMYS